MRTPRAIPAWPLTLAAIFALAPAAPAQPRAQTAAQTGAPSGTSTQVPHWPGAEPVDQGVVDVDPLARSLRVVPLDLRVPTGFDTVFRFGEGRSAMLGRVDGGVTALFPRSVYEPSRFGDIAAIPPGTQFIIGQPPEWLAEQHGAAPARTQQRPPLIQPRLDFRLDPTWTFDPSWTPSDPAPPAAPPPPRRGTVRELLRRAVAAERAAQ